MSLVAEEMERRGFEIPLLVGGAAASLAHTALKIDPVYSGPVVYVKDAGEAPGIVRRLSSPALRPGLLEELSTRYEEAVSGHNKREAARQFLSIDAARENRLRPDWQPPKPKTLGVIDLDDFPLEKTAPGFDWDMFFRKWSGQKSGQKDTLLEEDARALLDEIVQKKLLRLRGLAGIFPARSSGDDILVYAAQSPADKGAGVPALKIACLRNQTRRPAAAPNVSLADFIRQDDDWIGFFALSAGFGLDEARSLYTEKGDDYRAIIAALLADGLVEAFSEEAHRLLRREWWGYETEDGGRVQGIRPAFGYPSSPDHEDKRAVFRLLDAENKIGLRLTESGMIVPAASVCGMYFASPAAYYFSCGPIAPDQLSDWARRKDISPDAARRRAGFL
jgi:5-methyltetrahydrofolate--homocysteine methyltransferase